MTELSPHGVTGLHTAVQHLVIEPSSLCLATVDEWFHSRGEASVQQIAMPSDLPSLQLCLPCTTRANSLYLGPLTSFETQREIRGETNIATKENIEYNVAACAFCTACYHANFPSIDSVNVPQAGKLPAH